MSLIGNNGAYLGKKGGEVPIMSFQTNLNGTFAPIITPASGTLKWNIDGTDYVTNSPSVALTGNTVNVHVYANDVVEGETIGQCTFVNQGIIGNIDLNYFTCIMSTVGLFAIEQNPLLTGVIFGNRSNTIGNIRIRNNAIISALNFQYVTLTNGVNINGNTLMSSLIFKVTPQTIAGLNVSSTALSGTQDWSMFYMAGGTLNISSTAITGITFSASDNYGAITFGSNTSISTLDLSTGFRTNGTILGANCANLSTLSFKAGSYSSAIFLNPVNTSNLVTLDMSNMEARDTLYCYNNTALANFTPPTVTTGIANYRVNNCALTQTSVDAILSSLNTFFSSNTPIKNLLLLLDGGTNSSPTDGASNADLLNLISTFTGAGFTLTYAIN